MNSVTRRMMLQDAEAICRHREAMYREAGRPVEAIEAAREPFRRWLEPKLKDRSYLGWAVESNGVVVAGLGMIVLDWPPHPLHPFENRRGYILNVYVEREFRGRGLAKHLMLTAQAEARSMGMGYLVLHASDLGRPVYERLGWAATDEMSLRIEAEG
jgi:ribosomal protein S18 acetylase RimI-like enzyme